MLKKIKTSLAYMEKEMPTFSYHGWLEKGHSCWTGPNTPVQKSDPFSWQKFRGKLFHTNWEIQVVVDLSSQCLYKGRISLLVFWFLQFKAFESWQFFSELPRVYTALIVLKMLFINLWGFLQSTVVSVIYWKTCKDQNILIHFDRFLCCPELGSSSSP